MSNKDFSKAIANDWIEHQYYENVEDQNALNIFWGEDTTFLSYFKKLDTTNIVEIAMRSWKTCTEVY